MVSYSGAVTPGGSPDSRKLGSLTITKVAVDEQMSNNAYLLRCHGTGEQVLIDAAAEPAVLVVHSRNGIVAAQAAEARPDRIRKLVYLAIQNAVPRWTRTRGWTKALLAFKIHFGDRLPD